MQSATLCTLLLSVIFKKKNVFPGHLTFGLQGLYRNILCNFLEIIMEELEFKD